MKKTLIIGVLLLAIGAGSLVAYADTAKTSSINPRDLKSSFTAEEREAWFEEKTELKKEQIKKAVEDGRMTEAEAKEWEGHFAEMEKFHKENNFNPGECGLGTGMGMHMGKGRGNGMGMMRGNGMKRGNMR